MQSVSLEPSARARVDDDRKRAEIVVAVAVVILRIAFARRHVCIARRPKTLERASLCRQMIELVLNDRLGKKIRVKCKCVCAKRRVARGVPRRRRPRRRAEACKGERHHEKVAQSSMRSRIDARATSRIRSTDRIARRIARITARTTRSVT